jgi:exosortase/archaeosortase family protein
VSKSDGGSAPFETTPGGRHPPAEMKTGRMLGELRAALGVGMLFLGFVAWDQSHWWRIKEDYAFGWLVPVFAIFVVRDRWPKIVAAWNACGSDGSPRAAGGQRMLLWAMVGASLGIGTALFLLGAFYRASVGTSQPATLAITVGAIGILLPLLVLNAPAGESQQTALGGRRPPAVSLWDDARVRLAALFVFPVLVWLISAPIVSAVENQLSLALLRRVVSVVAFVFDLLGLPLEQQGNVLNLPTGSVGVEDACSGIRSLTGCVFAGSFLAAVFLDRWWKKIALVVAAMLLAFLTNLGRSLFLTAWAYRHGPPAIEGVVHDVAGYAVLGLTVVGLIALLPLLNLQLGTARTKT